MESTHRYRLLIYFAALVLCLSVCFANAEEPGMHRGTGAENALLASPLHATFMPVLRQSFLAAPMAQTAAPVVSQSLLTQVSMDAQKPHRLFRHVSFSKRRPALVLVHIPAGGGSLQHANSADTASQTE